MKKFICVVLMIACLFTFTACSSNLDTAKNNFELQWDAYLQIIERTNSNLQTALDATKLFCENQTWENLKAARVATAVFSNDLKELQTLQEYLTDEDYDALIKEGIEVEVSAILPQQAAEEITSIKSYFLNLNTCLYFDCFTKAELEVICDWVDAVCEYLTANKKYTATTVNYVFLDVFKDEAKAKYDTYKEKYPTLLGGDYEWTEDMVKIYDDSDAALDIIETVKYVTLPEIEGRVEGIYENYEKVKENPVEIESLPVSLPMDGWMDFSTADILYFIENGDAGEVKAIDANTEYENDKIVGCIMAFNDVSFDEVQSYINALSQLGLDISESEGEMEDGKEWSVTYYINEYVVEIGQGTNYTYINATTSDLSFAPLWYIVK